ncbi:MAG TPA: sensor histidine kinase KdpD [Ktedonobacterales bacterium]|jgi:two-component system sensor histidine kinase KdpD|nr:sensor histidine kinase KdpD [Ktedonobacterales bacterium]
MADYSRSSHDERPDPETLLDRYQLRDLVPTTSEESVGSTDSSHPARGRLRIYLGMAAGVGKTYAMLNEGRRRKSRGTDVVIGWVETHGRALTEQQIGDLETVPRKRIEYRGVALEEMDLDAVLARKPAVTLVDELAHTNVPGSRHEKRYQDVEDLLAAGITVITTVNVQHLEGLNDLVEAITGARQRETIPDRLLDEAYDVELVDISPEALRARLRHGNVYPPERARLALERYFSTSNLTALRDLALQRVSAKTEQQLEALMQTDEDKGEVMRATPVSDRVLVVFEPGARARHALHEGWRMAHALRAPLYALAITVSTRLPAGAAETAMPIADCVRKAEDLGAEIIPTISAERIDSLAQIVRERRISLVIVCAAPQSGGWPLARSSLAERLLRQRLSASVLVVPCPREAQ